MDSQSCVSLKTGHGIRIISLIVVQAIYTAELMLNLLVNFEIFLQSWWNALDTVVVAISISLIIVDLTVVQDGSGFPANTIRLIRVFKVVRIFGRLKKLNEILFAIAATIVPVFHSFILLGVIMSIYAVLGTALYQDRTGFD